MFVSNVIALESRTLQRLVENVLRIQSTSQFAMTGMEGVSMREPRPSDAREQELRDTEYAGDLDQIDSRLWESNRKRICVLVGSAMLQLPVWGELSPLFWL